MDFGRRRKNLAPQFAVLHTASGITLAAWILISGSPVVSSEDVNFGVASELSKLPVNFDGRRKLIQLPTGAISKMGPWDRLRGGKSAHLKI